MNRLFQLLLLSCMFFASIATASNIGFVFMGGSAKDSAYAASYKSFLDSRGYPTTLIRMSEIPTTDFTPFQCILVGDGTGDHNSWGDSASVAIVKNAGTPIIGIGEGGYAYFGKLSLAIGYGNGAHGASDSLIAVDTSTALYRSPNPITLPPDLRLTLYTVSSPQVTIYNPNPTGGVVHLGGLAHGASYFPLISQHARYLFWGYSDPPDSMTATGKNLFVNSLELVLPNLIAWYPMTSSPKDTTSTQDSLIMANTSYQRGGIYCNGIYGTGTTLRTPNMPQFSFRSFSIAAKFIVPDSMERRNPLFIGGTSYRWIGFYFHDTGTVGMKYNNGYYQWSNACYSLNDLHDALVTYDSTLEIGRVYLDNTLVASAPFKIVFGTDANVGVSDLAAGKAFRGIIKDLRVYNSVLSPVATVPLQLQPKYAASGLATQQTFVWRRVAGASSYRLQIATDSTFTSGSLANASGLTDSSYTLAGMPGYSRIFWRVSTSTSAGSSVWNFTTGMPLPAKVVLVSPSQGAGLVPDSIRFIWHPSQPSVTQYGFVLANDSLLTSRVVDTLVVDTTIVRRNVGHNKTVWWSVTAKNAAGTSLYSASRSFTTTATGVIGKENIPTQYELFQNYPNPFNPTTVIRYAVAGSREQGLGTRLVRLVVYDLLGREVAVLVNENKTPGNYEVTFNAANLASGVYLYRLTAGNFVQMQKMLLLR